MNQGPSKGFSLPELLAALAIAMVLTGLALPTYREHRYAAERSQAIQALLSAERCRAEHESLARGEPLGPITQCLPGNSPNYQYLLVPAQGGLAEGHDWRAEPRGAQRADRCGTLVLDHQGRKSVLGSGEHGPDCWRGR